MPVDQQEKRFTFKDATLNNWEDGEVMSIEELDDDVPF